MVGVRFLVDLYCEDCVVWLLRDALLPVVCKGLDVAGLWGDQDFDDAAIVNMTCDVRRPFAVALLESHVYQDDRSRRKDDVLAGYLSAGWRVESIDPYPDHPEVSGVEGDEKDVPWSGPPLA